MILEELLYLLISFLFRNRSRTESNKNDFFNEYQMFSMDMACITSTRVITVQVGWHSTQM